MVYTLSLGMHSICITKLINSFNQQKEFPLYPFTQNPISIYICLTEHVERFTRSELAK